jgi:hypothetical protein
LGPLTRYADAIVVVCRTQRAAEHALRAIPQVLARLKLPLHPTPTRLVARQREGFAFLGFHFHKGRARRTGKLVPLRWPGQKALQAVRRRLRTHTARGGLRDSLAVVVAKLHPSIRGWRNYFRLGHSTQKLQALDRYVRQRLEQWVHARQQGHGAPDQLTALLRASGIEYFYAPGMGGTRP